MIYNGLIFLDVLTDKILLKVSEQVHNYKDLSIELDLKYSRDVIPLKELSSEKGDVIFHILEVEKYKYHSIEKADL